MDFNEDKIEVFKLETTDINHLFKHSGLKGNKLSNFVYDAEQEETSKPSALFKQLVESPKFNQLATNLLEPVFKIEFNRGGGATAEEVFYLLFSNEDKEVVAQFINTEMDFLLLLFEDFAAFLEWWISLYASDGFENYDEIFPSIMATEVLMCSLHCVDLYHRSYMESMLEYNGNLNLSVNTADFVELMEKALSARDKRWILPTLFELVPSLKKSNISLTPEHIKKVEELGFISEDEGVLTLGEISRLMGTEFITSFLGATGFQAKTLVKGEEVSLSRVFLATTVFTNHLCSFENSEDGSTRFSHQALNAEKLKRALVKWLEALLKAINKPIVDQKEKVEDKEVGMGFCGKCGSPISPNKKFCSKCGNPV